MSEKRKSPKNKPFIIVQPAEADAEAWRRCNHMKISKTSLDLTFAEVPGKEYQSTTSLAQSGAEVEALEPGKEHQSGPAYVEVEFNVEVQPASKHSSTTSLSESAAKVEELEPGKEQQSKAGVARPNSVAPPASKHQSKAGVARPNSVAPPASKHQSKAGVARPNSVAPPPSKHQSKAGVARPNSVAPPASKHQPIAVLRHRDDKRASLPLHHRYLYSPDNSKMGKTEYPQVMMFLGFCESDSAFLQRLFQAGYEEEEKNRKPIFDTFESWSQFVQGTAHLKTKKLCDEFFSGRTKEGRRNELWHEFAECKLRSHAWSNGLVTSLNDDEIRDSLDMSGYLPISKDSMADTHTPQLMMRERVEVANKEWKKLPKLGERRVTIVSFRSD